MYKTYVSPIAEYASVAWDPNTHKKHQENQTDPTQQRKVCHQYLLLQIEGHILILSELQCPSLQERRRQSRLAMLFRIHFNLVDINWNDHSLSQCVYYQTWYNGPGADPAAGKGRGAQVVDRQRGFQGAGRLAGVARGQGRVGKFCISELNLRFGAYFLPTLY